MTTVRYEGGIPRVLHDEIEAVSSTTINLTSASTPTVLCNALSNPITVNLPLASTCEGVMFIIKKVDASVNAVTVQPSGSDKIDGLSTYVISQQFLTVSIQSDGSAWFILEVSNTDVNGETTARMVADSSLQSHINSEITARANADSSLQSELDTTQGSLGTFIDGDGAWLGFSGTNYLNSKLTFTTAMVELDSQAALETTARSNADSTITSNLNSEITSRTNADSTLTSNLNSEITARSNADSTLQSHIDSEATSRANADSTLTTNLNSEITSRQNADSTLTASLNSEITARTNAVSAVTTNSYGVTTNASILANDEVFADTTSGIITLTLPASPATGNRVRVLDPKGTWGTNKCVIARNGNKIAGFSSDLELTAAGDSVELVFYSTTSDWRIP